MAKDPVCRMTVNEANPPSGKSYYFCSSGCKRSFDTEPAKYAAKA